MMDMKLYMAPMEGLTGYVLRKAYHRCFDDADRYFTPFVSSKGLSSKERKDVLPENNAGMEVVPQILTNRAEEFVIIANNLMDNYGYGEVNFNLGCPSGTVVAKGRGSGFLDHPKELEEFLDYIFTHSKPQISIKTRLGVESKEGFRDILLLYNKFPLTELIVHPRLRVDGYGGKPDLECYKLATEISKHSLCYNGDVNSVEDYNRIREIFPGTTKIMCGRGLLTNPGLFGEIRGKKAMTMDALRAFEKAVFEGYREIMSGDKNVLFKVKELWIYFSKNFENSDKVLKKVRKTQTCAQYEEVVAQIFEEAKTGGL